MTVEQGRAHPKIITATGALRWPVTIAFAVFMGLLALACALVIGEVRDGRQEREEVARRQEDDAALLCRVDGESKETMSEVLEAFAMSEVPVPPEADPWFHDYVKALRADRRNPEITERVAKVLAPLPECATKSPPTP